MKKKYISKSTYMKARRNYLASLNRYLKQGYDININKFRPSIPKRPTEGSIRKLESLYKNLIETVHEQRVETGYYTRQREQRQIKARLKKLALTKPKVKKIGFKKSPVKIPTQIPKAKGKQTQPPNLSDAVLRSFESEMNIARGYIAKSKPYQDAVNKAGSEAQSAFQNEIDRILNKYVPDLNLHDIRVEVAQRLSENFNTYMSEIEAFLYEFISDGQGSLNHTMAGLQSLEALIKAISNAELTIEEKKVLEELANDEEGGDVVDGIGEYYDY